jgi:hypothetical protein
MCFYHLEIFLGLDSSEIRELYRLDGMLTVWSVQLQATGCAAKAFSPHANHLLYHRQPRGDRMSDALPAEQHRRQGLFIQEPA